MAFKLSSNPNAPHKAVIFIRAEVHPVLPTGECSGDPAVRIQEFPVAISGENRDDAVKKMNEFLAEIKTRCKCGR